MMQATLSAAPLRQAPGKPREPAATSAHTDAGVVGAGLSMSLHVPDLNDPIVRQLPISALALAFAMLEAGRQPVCGQADVGHQPGQRKLPVWPSE